MKILQLSVGLLLAASVNIHAMEEFVEAFEEAHNLPNVGALKSGKKAKTTEQGTAETKQEDGQSSAINELQTAYDDKDSSKKESLFIEARKATLKALGKDESDDDSSDSDQEEQLSQRLITLRRTHSYLKEHRSWLSCLLPTNENGLIKQYKKLVLNTAQQLGDEITKKESKKRKRSE